MRASQIYLKQEVTRNDAMIIKKWMENYEITKYLNETVNIGPEIQLAIDKVNMFIMTHIFNQNGGFYLIHADDNNPIGFLKLVRKQMEAEMVIVIGDKNIWGRGIGKSSIKKGLEIAFFQWRVNRVVAKIHPNNQRSVKAFENLGFVLEDEYKNLKVYSLSMNDFIRKLTG